MQPSESHVPGQQRRGGPGRHRYARCTPGGMLRARLLAAVVGAASLACLAGCGSAGRYVYSPEDNATARVSGRPAALYDVPPQAPHGQVRVATLGIATLEPRGEDGHRVRTMHVRMIVDNDGDVAPWQVDTREQLGTLPRYGQSRAAFVASSEGRPPLVTVAPGASATLDLYYPLPADMQHAAEIPEFQVLWRVQTPEGAVAERTRFERLRLEPPPAYYAYGPGWGPGWGTGWGWYDPLWADYAFWGAPVLGGVWVERPVVQGPRPAPPRAR